MAMAVPSYGYGIGNGYDDDHGYGSPELWPWQSIAMAALMDATMAKGMVIAVMGMRIIRVIRISTSSLAQPHL